MPGTGQSRLPSSHGERLLTKIPRAAETSCDPALGRKLFDYTVQLDDLESVDEVLDRLHAITARYCGVNVLGAAIFPLSWGDWSSVERGRTVFLHESVPEGFWEHYLELGRKHLHPGLLMAQHSLSSFTWTESRRVLEPIGVERWPYELALKYGMRDGLICPIGGRWIVVYWSPKVLSSILTPQLKVHLITAATFAAIRLQQLVAPSVRRVGKRASLTPRELAVLRSLSLGHRTRETAERLQVGEETVRTHLKNAEAKLGVRDRAHAVAQALRLQLIP